MALFLFTKAILEGKPIDVFNHGNMRARLHLRRRHRRRRGARAWTASPRPIRRSTPARPDPGTSNAPYRVFNIGNNEPVELHATSSRPSSTRSAARRRRTSCRCSRATCPRPTPTSMRSSAGHRLRAADGRARGRAPLRRLVPRFLRSAVMQPVVAVVAWAMSGLPLAVEFGKHSAPSASTARRRGFAHPRRQRPDRRDDRAGPASRDAVRPAAPTIRRRLKEADFIIVAVPTPVIGQPAGFRAAGERLARRGRPSQGGRHRGLRVDRLSGRDRRHLRAGARARLGGRWKKDFFVGYSPERINPGDREHTLPRIVKVVSGDTPETLEKVAALYGGSSPPACIARPASRRRKRPR